jgi:nitrate/TMAO reductase-like tetraheme cytochrome c subunit
MKIPKSIYNWLSLAGIFLAANSLILIIILFIISITLDTGHSYWGLYIYIVLPLILIIGLIMIPIGMLLTYKKLKTKESISTHKLPILDLNHRNHRKTLAIVSIVTLVFVLISAGGSYQAFHYSESVDFCGKLCHSVMKPEYVTYLNSPHARVKCVECHVGSGADWYVKSKLSGLYQVYSVWFNKYPRPIPTPLHNLRPARETCENCHWPQKFYAKKLRNQRGFLKDSANTAWNISLLMKIGPDYSAYGLSEGIHWHISDDIKMEYVASTNDRESIPWIRYTNKKTGVVKVFQDQDNKLTDKAFDTLQVKIMDCMDCHNRPSHSYKSAPVYLDNAMLTGSIPTDLPYIKRAAMKVLKDQFSTSDSARLMIDQGINAYYKKKYPEIFTSKKLLIDKAIAGIQLAYSLNNFPEMKASNDSYLNHIGHLESNGCFRCHSGRHKSETGETISKDCDLCHTIVSQGTISAANAVKINESLEFKHPIDIGDDWKENACSECHRDL